MHSQLTTIPLHFHSDVERETNLNFIDQRFMQHIEHQHSSGESFNSKNYFSDGNQNVDPMLLGSELLSRSENKICSTMNLPPTKYLTIKTVLLSNPKISDIEPTEKVILKHLSNAGWIRKS